MPKPKISIENIKDAEAYVRSSLPKVLMSTETREDLVQTGLLILRELQRKYQPGIGGREASGSTFSGYVEGQHFDDKLRDQWHRLEGHRLTSDGKGGREWVYPPTRASLDQMAERDGGLDNIGALQGEDTYDSDLMGNVRAALRAHLQRVEDRTIQIAMLLSEELPASAIAERLGLREKDVVTAGQLLIEIAPAITTMEAA